MNFKKWLMEVGGSGGVGGGLTPPVESPARYVGAFAVHHGKSEADPKDQNGTLPPVPQNKEKGILIRRKKTLSKP